MEFRNRIAVVTGAASGIGAALAGELARRGAKVAIADIDEGNACEVATRIGDRAVPEFVDVTSAGSVERLADNVTERFGRIDIWVNNAGIAVGGAAHEIDLRDWRRVLDVNLAGVVHGVHAVYPRMIRQRAGYIVNVASVAGLAPYPLALPYTTSKHAVVGLSQALRAEARGHGVDVSVVCPGMIRTPIWERASVRGTLGRHRSRVLARLPSAMSPERCAEAIVRGMIAKRGVIPITSEARAAWWLNRLSPSLAAHVSQRLVGFTRRLAP